MTKKLRIVTGTIAGVAALLCGLAVTACTNGYNGKHDIPGINANAVLFIENNRLGFARGMKIDPVDVIERCGCVLTDDEGNEVRITRKHLEDGTVKYERFDLDNVGSDKRVEISYKKASNYILYDVNDYKINYYLDEDQTELWKSVSASSALNDALELSVWVDLDDYNYSTDEGVRKKDEARANRFDGWFNRDGKAVTGVHTITDGAIANETVVNLHAHFLTQAEREKLLLSYDARGRRVFSGYTGEQTETVRIPEGVTYVALSEIFSQTPQATPIGFRKLHFSSTARIDNPLASHVNTTGLEAVTVDEGNRVYASYKGALYSKNYQTLLFMPASSMMTDFHDSLKEFARYSCAYWQINTLVIPDSVTTLGDFCFAYSLLNDVVGFENVTSIMQGVFVGTALSFDDGVGLYSKEANGKYTLGMILDKNITSYVLKEGTASIAGDAFARCEKLVSVDLGEDLERIGDSAFSGCVSLKEIRLPAKMQYFGTAVFYGCKALETVEGLQNITWQAGRIIEEPYVLPESLFYGCESLKNIKLPDTLKAIGAAAFYGCSSLEQIELPQTLTSIGASAFHSSGLKSIVLPVSLVSLGEAAFYKSNLASIDLSACVNLQALSKRCFQESSLTEVTVPDHITAVPDYCFYYIGTLKKVSLGNVSQIGERAFSYCTALDTVEWSENLVSIGARAFSNCYALTEVILPDSVETVGSYAFQRCDGLLKLTLGANVKTFGVYTYAADGKTFNLAQLALYQCYNLEEIAVNEGNAFFTSVDGVLYGKGACAQEYGESAVLYSVPAAYPKTSLKLPDSVRILLPYAFQFQKTITTLTLNEGLENIGKAAFYSSSALETLHLPATVTQIGAGILLNSNIASFSIDENNQTYSSDGNLIYRGEELVIYIGLSPAVTIRDGITTIASGVFMNNAVIADVVIPDSVTKIGAKAFNGCSQLTSISIGSGLKELGDAVFASLPALERITVSSDNRSFKAVNNILYTKDGTKLVLCAARNGMENLEIEAGVTEIGEYAFASHATLKGVKLPEGIKKIGAFAFYDCKRIEYFYACESLEEIGERAFSFSKSIDPSVATETRYNNALKTVLLYSRLKTVGDYAFYGQYGIETTYFRMTREEVTALVDASGINWEYFYFGCPMGSTGKYYNDVARYLYRETPPDNLTVNHDGFGWFRFDENGAPIAW